MSKFLKYTRTRTVWLLKLALPVVLLMGCGARGDIPITTPSEKAQQIFLDARQAYENIRLVEARILFSKAIRKDPDFALAYLYLARSTDDPEERESSMKRAVALESGVSKGEQLLIDAYRAYLLESNRELWGKRIRELARKYPRDKRANHELGIVYFYNYDELDKAITYYLKAIAIDADYAPTYNMLGYSYRRKGEYEQAKEAFQNYIRLIPDEPNPYDSMADLLTKMGRFEEAIDYYQMAIERDPTFTPSQGKTGINLVFMGRYEDGRAAIQTAVETAVTPSYKIMEMGRIARSYIYEGEYQRALAQLDTVIQAAAAANLPQFVADGHLAKCILQIQKQDIDAAEQSLAACREMMQATGFPTLERQAFERATQLREAYIAAKRKHFEAALAGAAQLKTDIEAGHNPDEMKNIYFPLMGLIYFEQGSYEKAIEYFQQADQENPLILYHYGLSEAGAGHQDRAAELYYKAAHWNEDYFSYALVRAKALAAIKD
ncbi:MAG: tetratricopeptide repeat protein [Candidatus Neomarinimicrobiota bacterium]